MTKNTISGLLSARDGMLGELLALRDRCASVYNDIEAIDRVLDALGYDGPPLEERQPRQHRLVIFARNELRQFLLRELRKGEPLRKGGSAVPFVIACVTYVTYIVR